MNMNLFEGKRGLILGLANERSLTWGISKVLHANGAELAFNYQPGILENKVKALAASLNSPYVNVCDLSNDEDMQKFFDELKNVWDTFDFLVHGVAFADKEDLQGRYVDTSRAGFLKALNISCYSFTKAVQLSEPFFNRGGSCITLSYYGAQKWMPNYNVMGVAKAALEASVQYLASDMGPLNVRVNAISAGPLRTLASSGISDFTYLLDWYKKNAPLQRNITTEDVGNMALYLLSDLSSCVTGQTLYVDGGYSIRGMPVQSELKA